MATLVCAFSLFLLRTSASPSQFFMNARFNSRMACCLSCCLSMIRIRIRIRIISVVRTDLSSSRLLRLTEAGSTPVQRRLALSPRPAVPRGRVVHSDSPFVASDTTRLGWEKGLLSLKGAHHKEISHRAIVGPECCVRHLTVSGALELCDPWIRERVGGKLRNGGCLNASFYISRKPQSLSSTSASSSFPPASAIAGLRHRQGSHGALGGSCHVILITCYAVPPAHASLTSSLGFL